MSATERNLIRAALTAPPASDIGGSAPVASTSGDTTDLGTLHAPIVSAQIEKIRSLLDQASQIQEQRNTADAQVLHAQHLTRIGEFLDQVEETPAAARISLDAILTFAEQLGVSKESIDAALNQVSPVTHWENNRLQLAQSLKLPEDASPARIASEINLRNRVDDLKDSLDEYIEQLASNPVAYRDMSRELGYACATSLEDCYPAFGTTLNPRFIPSLLFQLTPIVGWATAVISFFDKNSILPPITLPATTRPISPALIELQELAASKSARIIYSLEKESNNLFTFPLCRLTNPAYEGLKITLQLK